MLDYKTMYEKLKDSLTNDNGWEYCQPSIMKLECTQADYDSCNCTNCMKKGFEEFEKQHILIEEPLISDKKFFDVCVGKDWEAGINKKSHGFTVVFFKESICNGPSYDKDKINDLIDKKIVQLDTPYTIDYLDISGYSSDVILQELNNLKFNSVQLIDYETKERRKNE